MKRCVILGGAEIGSYGAIREYLREGDFIICCDRGLVHAEPLSLTPDLIVGDFDSHEKPDLPVETIVLPREKDDTDTVFAVREALRRGFQEFLFLGAAGERLDHTLGNLSLLLMLHAEGKKALLLDDYSEISVVGKEGATVSDRFSYFSLLCVTEPAGLVTIRNAKYPLNEATISYDYPIGVSNEVLPGKTAEIAVGSGRLLLIKVRG